MATPVIELPIVLKTLFVSTYLPIGICIISNWKEIEQTHLLLTSRDPRPVVLNRWATACKSGRPQLGMLMHKCATARKLGGPRTSVYFENGFACRIKLKN